MKCAAQKQIRNLSSANCDALTLWHDRFLLFARICVLAFFSAALLTGCGSVQRLSNNDAPVSAQKAVRAAYSQMGKKYRPGGASPQKGFDCSGLIWWAYKQVGMNIPRLTVDQAKTGSAVSSSTALPGDIVVFRTGRNPQGLHTGLYAGGDTFIHSPRSGERVRMESITVPYWRDKLLTVRRVVR